MRPTLQTPLFKSVLFLAAITMYSCQEKDPFSVTEADMVTDMVKNKNYEKLVNYAQSIGIEADTSVYRKVGMLKFLQEIGYGHKPTHLKYVEKELTPDTTLVKQAGWELARGTDIEKAVKDLEPPYEAYKSLKTHYQRLTAGGQVDSAAMVAEALNTYRWIHRQSQGSDRMILVNVRGAYLKALDSLGNEEFRMNVIVGKSKSPTPSLDTYATNVITYPYWNVPKSIATAEMLPRIQENMYYFQRNGIEVLDKKGQVVDEFEIAWNELSADSLPYRFRQETGEDNSLGFMKMNIENPYAIYLHDTNVRSLFASEERWRSHGCVRLEDPVKVANFLAGEKLLDENFVEDALAAPEEEHEPETHTFDRKIPTFIYYMPADVDKAGNLTFYKDVYDLDKTGPRVAGVR